LVVPPPNPTGPVEILGLTQSFYFNGLPFSPLLRMHPDPKLH
jgi:hypothetical protein